MLTYCKSLAWIGLLLGLLPGLALAGAPDEYLGDASIYADTGAYTSSGERIRVRSNVLFIVDNSAAMRQTGGTAPYEPYEKDAEGKPDKSKPRVYPGSYEPWAVYELISETAGTLNYKKLSKIPPLRTSNTSGVNPALTAVMCGSAVDEFENFGVHFGKLDRNSGACTTKKNDDGKFYLGNLINYINSPQDGAPWKAGTAYAAGARILVTYSASPHTNLQAIFIASQAGTSGANAPAWPTLATGGEIVDGTVRWRMADDYSVWQPTSAIAVGTRVAVKLDGATVAFEVVGVVDAGGNFTQATSGTSAASQPVWADAYENASGGVRDGNLLWKPVGSILDTVKDVLQMVMQLARNSAKMGLMTFGGNNSGGQILAPVRGVSDESEIDASGATHFSFLTGKVAGISMLKGNHKPVNETLWDAGLYFQGKNSSTDKIASERTAYPSPVTENCERNYVILLTTGSDNDNVHTSKVLKDYTGDGQAGLVDDAAYYIGNLDLAPDYPGTQGIVTHVIQLMTQEVPRLRAAAEVWGGWNEGEKQYRGTYQIARNSAELTSKLLSLMGGLVAEENTSFVAPVVPASTTNRTISGNRVYLGLFKPQIESAWHGNLKKYQVGADNRLKDKNGNDATYTEAEAAGIDGVKAGDFKPNSVSFWSSSGDGGDVLKGGAGELLKQNSARKIFTYLPQVANQPKALADAESKNAFVPGNSLLTPALLNVDDEDEADLLINWVRGQDAYDANGDGNTAQMRSWIMGDILHSKPLVLAYAPFTMTDANEASCEVNKSYIFVGANDGMLHAFRDCDGSEAWAYIPDNVLGHLKYMRNGVHTPFVDAPISAYIHDKNDNGVIEPLLGDKVLLMFGQRRGGSGSTLGDPRGAFYILDVTSPEEPQFVAKVDGSSWAEMGQSWSQPRLARIKHGTAIKIVAFLGGGYDNNEDLRFGNTQLFPADTTAATDISNADDGGGPRTSSGVTATKANPKGRGVFAVEIARLDKVDGKFNAVTDDAGTILWSYGPTQNPDLTFSIPSDITALDVNANGFTDRLYVGDTGGRMWRFDVGSSNLTDWSGRIVFRANPGTDGSNGRKFFYRPAVTFNKGYPILHFGSGDREHPLNRAVVDRLYTVIDRGQGSTDSINESSLVDVTENTLQHTGDQAVINAILNELNSSSKYGWFIKLNESGHAGEKVLAGTTVFNNVVYYTTYTPNIILTPDPCKPGNLGVARVYQVDAKTGEAVINNDKSNDGDDANERAAHKDGYVLKRSDRILEIGEGIPSGIVTLIDASGRVTMMISSSNRVNTVDALSARMINPVYWMQW
ncbi:pilus assembly protein [Geoalkalibacter sp.]|uniref:pilus assembly protein n=1 Tax=Geoalkalibacter sp. TaxID=3041440 RepID=UPI00272E056A|nr:PilC/PilY family type IV pilus protein [Geoalkalibacter sp.]